MLRICLVLDKMPDFQGRVATRDYCLERCVLLTFLLPERVPLSLFLSLIHINTTDKTVPRIDVIDLLANIAAGHSYKNKKKADVSSSFQVYLSYCFHSRVSCSVYATEVLSLTP